MERERKKEKRFHLPRQKKKDQTSEKRKVQGKRERERNKRAIHKITRSTIVVLIWVTRVG